MIDETVVAVQLHNAVSDKTNSEYKNRKLSERDGVNVPLNVELITISLSSRTLKLYYLR